MLQCIARANSNGEIAIAYGGYLRRKMQTRNGRVVELSRRELFVVLAAPLTGSFPRLAPGGLGSEPTQHD